MEITREQFAGELTGTLTNAVIDASVNVDVAHGYVAISPLVAVTGSTTLGGSDLAGGSYPKNAGNDWQTSGTTLYTNQTGDYVEIDYTSGDVGATITMQGIPVGTGVLGTDAIGGIATVLVNGTRVGNLDCNTNSLALSLVLPSGSGALRIQHSGLYDALASPIGVLSGSAATGLLNTVILPSSTQKALTPATWRLQVTTSGGSGVGRYNLYKTPAGGSESLVASGLVCGTTYDSVGEVPGIALTVDGPLTVIDRPVMGWPILTFPEPDMVGGGVAYDSASFTTDALYVAIASVVIRTGVGTNTGSYTSQVYDTANSDTSFVDLRVDCSDFVQGHIPGSDGYVAASVTLFTGQTDTPDGSWQSFSTGLIDARDSRGNRLGTAVAGLLGAMPGQYFTVSLTFPEDLTTTPYARNVRIGWWVPRLDRDVAVHFVPIGVPWQPGQYLHAFMGALALQYGATRQNMLDLMAAYCIGGARGPYLMAWARDLGMPYFLGEPTQSAQGRLQAAFASRSHAVSPNDIALQLGRLVGGVACTTVIVLTGGLQTVTASSSGLSTGNVVVAQTGPWALTVSIPPPDGAYYPGLPGLPAPLAQEIITSLLEALLPVGPSVGGAGNVAPTFN
jgi:hypothetical protein